MVFCHLQALVKFVQIFFLLLTLLLLLLLLKILYHLGFLFEIFEHGIGPFQLESLRVLLVLVPFLGSSLAEYLGLFTGFFSLVIGSVSTSAQLALHFGKQSLCHIEI